MKLRHYAVILLSGLSVSAQAETAGWSGCHAGLNLGYGNGDNQSTALYTIPPNDTGSASSDGPAGGIQLGCDLQHGRLVAGLQGLVDIADLDGDHVFLHGTSPNDRFHYQTTGLAMLTGRAGYLLNDTWLLYGKAGWAWARYKYTDSDPTPPVESPYIDSARATRSGWVAGLGVEHAVAEKFSVFAEYSHMEFGKKNITLTETSGDFVGNVFQYRIDQDIDAVLIGLNYRF